MDTPETVVVAAAQMQSGGDPEENRGRASELVRRAAGRGAAVVGLPENVLFEGAPGEPVVHDVVRWSERFAALAREASVSIVAGTLGEPSQPGALPFNTTLAFAADGRCVGRYRKIHLFDVDVPGGPNERESARLSSGEPEAVVVDLPPLGAVGLSICYDLRFPELYRELVAAGARTLFVPASFAMGTGRDHWETLLRARAIENVAWVVAPAQHGTTPDGRAKYGRAMVVDPWGTVLAVAPDGRDGLAVAELEMGRQDRIRRALPCLDHARLGPLAAR